MINSLDIARIIDKRHVDVKRDIRKISGGQFTHPRKMIIRNPDTDKEVEVYILTEQQIFSLPYSKIIFLKQEVDSINGRVGILHTQLLEQNERIDFLEKDNFDLKVRLEESIKIAKDFGERLLKIENDKKIKKLKRMRRKLW